jgi:hypothetical protein
LRLLAVVGCGLRAAAEEGGGEDAMGELLGVAGGGLLKGSAFVDLRGDVVERAVDGFLGELFRAPFDGGFDRGTEGLLGGFTRGGVVQGLTAAGHDLAEGEADGAGGDGGACSDELSKFSLLSCFVCEGFFQLFAPISHFISFRWIACKIYRSIAAHSDIVAHDLQAILICNAAENGRELTDLESVIDVNGGRQQAGVSLITDWKFPGCIALMVLGAGGQNRDAPVE